MKTNCSGKIGHDLRPFKRNHDKKGSQTLVGEKIRIFPKLSAYGKTGRTRGRTPNGLTGTLQPQTERSETNLRHGEDRGTVNLTGLR